jgi:predicted phosphodiesterase
MRVAVLSDVHGFNLALEAVFADLDATGPYDEVVVAGDLCEVGPAPAEVLALLRTRRPAPTVLMGNTDRDLVAAAGEDRGAGGHPYALERIGDDGVAYLAALPFARRITPPGGASPDDDLLVVHANPHDLERKLDPAMSDRELREVLGETRAAAVAFGHIHIAYTRRLGDTLLVDVSAVGNPKDGDLRCKYGVLTWDGASHAWSAEIRRLPYPLDATAAQILASGLPDPAGTLRKLERASYRA